ncbi:MAG TPA: hypothetical protein VFA57_20250 [Pseudolabrys sp.]|jgi:hypothetical protein|nr:hypothetical protein [Pseudolabrys sp.]
MEALERWHDFYVLLGTAGATLVALLFVAVSLGAGFLSPTRSAATRAFFSTVVLHFTAVFFVSALSLVPAHRGPLFAALIAVAALIGGTAAVFTTVQLLRHDWTKFVQDHLGYGMLPSLCYAALLVAAWLVFTGQGAALDVLAGALLTLLVVNIRNAWDLTLSMVHRQAERK